MKMLLNGKKVGTEGREEIIVINPYTHEEIDRVPCADLNDIDTALECAREGAEKWGRVPVLERVRILEKVSSKIAEKKKQGKSIRRPRRKLIMRSDCLKSTQTD